MKRAVIGVSEIVLGNMLLFPDRVRITGCRWDEEYRQIILYLSGHDLPDGTESVDGERLSTIRATYTRTEDGSTKFEGFSLA